MAANTGESRVAGGLLDLFVDWAKNEARLDGSLVEGMSVTDARATKVWGNHFRVNLYTKELPEGNFIVPEYRIVASYLVEWRGGKVVHNRTKRPNSALNE